MKLMVGAVIAATLVAGAAHAGDWRLVNDANGGAEFLDISSIQTTQTGKTTVWTGMAFPRANDGADYNVVHNEFDCVSRTHRMLSMYIYNSRGQLLRSGSIEEAAMPVIPDTNGHGMLQAVCRSGDYGERGFNNMRDAMIGYRGFLSRN
ncbi:hypothetical protein O3U67_10805 [Brevundimonas diminuta]|uniref:surface-adhesin E family protein n=1 Tax=Brevundimonas diminuta TaxID=293 RepID=UPI0022AE63F9|nr:surface-adhesin E family protein [Brevundimonas diminuta]MCZ4108571.1 hypothetical protein [Brevundimonas diminuta]